MSGARPHVLMVVLGGTITMTAGEGGGIAPRLTADDLIAAVPALAAVGTIEPASPFRMPGASLTLGDLAEVARLIGRHLDAGADGAVVVQGTDTIEETAFVLDLLIGGDKPVVVTGAMRGPEAPGADGPANLLAAAQVAASPACRGLGTVVVLNDEIHAARWVQKTHTGSPAAFRSPAAGPLGAVVEGVPRLALRPAGTHRALAMPAQFDLPVALVTVGLGDDGRLLAALPGLGYRGAVIAAMGAGHLPARLVPAVETLLAAMPVALASRVGSGPVFERTYGFPGSEIDLIRRGAIPTGSLGGLKARLLMSLLLGAGAATDDLRAAFVERGGG